MNFFSSLLPPVGPVLPLVLRLPSLTYRLWAIVLNRKQNTKLDTTTTDSLSDDSNNRNSYGISPLETLTLRP